MALGISPFRNKGYGLKVGKGLNNKRYKGMPNKTEKETILEAVNRFIKENKDSLHEGDDRRIGFEWFKEWVEENFRFRK